MDPEHLQEAKMRRKQMDKDRKQSLEENTSVMFENMRQYLHNEFTGMPISYLKSCLHIATSDEYKLLEQMNVMTREKYLEMTKVAALLTDEMTDLQQKCTCDSVCDSVCDSTLLRLPHFH
jgi:hypothetical protein